MACSLFVTFSKIGLIDPLSPMRRGLPCEEPLFSFSDSLAGT